jgi:hypothetical protein
LQLTPKKGFFMSTVEQLDFAVESPHLELVASGTGQIAAGEAVEVEAPQDTYKYQVVYGKDDRIAGGESWKYDAEADESTFTCVDAAGKVVDRFVESKAMGLTFQYSGERLVYSSHTSDDGKNIERTWYGANRQPVSMVEIDKAANTHTMTIFQPGIGNWVHTDPYEGVDGWTSTAPRIG